MSSLSKAVDLLPVLTHILGRAVPRGGQLGEFVCGKCACVLERVFKFDSVMARVRALSSQRLQKMRQERNRIRQWVRQHYCQRHPPDFEKRDDADEEDAALGKEGYREMLRENMALSEYECWSERWENACPCFIKTGKRCRKGKGCEGCDFLRVSDSDYESVCGVPRHLPFQPLSPFGLTRDKSRSMPLHWQEEPLDGSGPPSPTGSTSSFPGLSRSEFTASPDSDDGRPPSDWPGFLSADFVLRELKGVEGKPLRSPAGSRIPVLDRRNSSYLDKAEAPAPPLVRSPLLSFGALGNGGDEMEEEDGDVSTDLRDDFLPLREEVSQELLL